MSISLEMTELNNQLSIDIIHCEFSGETNPFEFNYALIVKPVFKLFKSGRKLPYILYVPNIELYIGKFYYDTLLIYIDYTCVIYRILYRCKRIIRRWRNKMVRRKLEYINTTDLLLCELPKYTIELIDGLKCFRFSPRDIIGFYTSTLLQSRDMIPISEAPRNPYNHIIISPTRCAYIYYHLRLLGIKIPLIMLLYERSQFDIKLFREEWCQWLSLNAIKSWIYNEADKTDLVYIVESIIYRLDKNVDIAIKLLHNMSYEEIIDRFFNNICYEQAYVNGTLHQRSESIDNTIELWINCLNPRRPILIAKRKQDL